MSANLTCSVVIATQTRAAQLEQCLASLRGMDGTQPEIVVVDNSSGDERTKQVVEAADARFVQVPVGGLSRARTLGARAATGDLVAFIDDDAIADRRWLQVHQAAFSDPAIAATTGAILPMGAESDDEGYVTTSGQFMATERLQLDRFGDAWFERANFGGLGNGGNMVFRRDLFDAGWGFHEDLGLPQPMGGEEHFAFYELIRNGWRIEHLPEAQVWHPAIQSAEELTRYYRRQVRSASSYMVLLIVEGRGFRRRSLRYLMESMQGKRREWRPRHTDTDPTPLPRMSLRAAASPWLYFRRRISCRYRLERLPPPAGPLKGAHDREGLR